MKKKMLLLALLVMSASAFADWTKLEFAGDGLTLHVDMSTLKNSGHGTTEIWYVINYAAQQQVDGKPFRSLKGQSEYDCSNGKSREMLQLWHADPFGNSKMMQFSHTPYNAWVIPADGSVDRALMQLVCKQK